MKLLPILGSLCYLLLSSCVNQRKVLDSWVDKEEYQLIEKWGPPVRRASNGSNGEILIYSQQFYSNGTTYYKYTMFYEYANGIIYHWLVQIGTVPPQRINIDIYI